jgi:hypothetical protein
MGNREVPRIGILRARADLRARAEASLGEEGGSRGKHFPRATEPEAEEAATQ